MDINSCTLNCDKIVWSGGISDSDANFGSILRILAPKPEEGEGDGLNTLRENGNEAGACTYCKTAESMLMCAHLVVHK